MASPLPSVNPFTVLDSLDSTEDTAHVAANTNASQTFVMPERSSLFKMSWADMSENQEPTSLMPDEKHSGTVAPNKPLTFFQKRQQAWNNNKGGGQCKVAERGSLRGSSSSTLDRKSPSQTSSGPAPNCFFFDTCRGTAKIKFAARGKRAAVFWPYCDTCYTGRQGAVCVIDRCGKLTNLSSTAGKFHSHCNDCREQRLHKPRTGKTASVTHTQTDTAEETGTETDTQQTKS